MMSDNEIHFETNTFSSASTTASPTAYTKPSDILQAPPPAPNTTWYLAIIRPHTDSHEMIGPMKVFSHLMPKITYIISNSPSAIDKLDALQRQENVWGEWEENAEFPVNGFEIMVVEGQRGIYTVLKVIRKIEKEVFDNLPAPVYTVIATGPLVHPPTPVWFKGNTPPKPVGFAATTRLVGSFINRDTAKAAAQSAMAALTSGQTRFQMSENWEKGGKGGGLLMTMSVGQLWEVRAVYEDEALRRAWEGLERDGEAPGWRF